MLILLVGLQAIPPEVYEAAAIDGASRWQTFRRITLPLLRPSLALALILCITGSLLAFDQFYILTKGGPDNTTVTVVQLIYREAFQRQNLGTAAALSMIVLVVLLLINAIQFRGLRSADAADDARCASSGLSADARGYVADRRARDHLPVPADLERRRVGQPASPGTGAGRLASGSATTRRCSTTARACRQYVANSVFVSVLDRGAHAGRLAPRRLCVRPVRVPGPERAVPADAGDPDGPVRDAADPAVRAAEGARARRTRCSACRWC